MKQMPHRNRGDRLKERSDQLIVKKSRPSEIGVKKPHRYRPGVVALREIRRYQKTTNLLIPILPFQRLVREIAESMKQELRFQATALLCIHSSAESYLTDLFSDAIRCTLHRKKCTLTVADIKLARRLRNEC